MTHTLEIRPHVDWRGTWDSADLTAESTHYIVAGHDIYCKGFGFVRVTGQQGLITCNRCGTICLRVKTK